jgi:ketosteroid isomerase-like protein
MLKKSWVWILLVAVGLSVAQEAGIKADTNPAAEAEIKNVEMELAKLLVKEDWDKYAAFLTEDYVRTTSKGNVQNKQEFMGDVRSPDKKVLDMMPEELQVRVFGESAILTGHLTMLARQNGRVTTSFSRYTKIFVKRNDRWMLAAEQSTTVLK